MEIGAITGYIDVAQLVLYVFWGFFFALILWLRREDKREGYPLESERSAHITVQGFPSIPAAKEFKLPHGGTKMAPDRVADTRPVAAQPSAPWPGAPLEPTGNPMVDGVGPAAWAERAESPDLTLSGENRIVPMRVASDWVVESRDPDPRGMSVLGADGEVAGEVIDMWVDRTEPHVRYLEVKVKQGRKKAKNVLLPIYFARIDRAARSVKVRSIMAAHFYDVPELANPDQVTLREEDRISAYYGGGTLYADPKRLEPVL